MPGGLPFPVEKFPRVHGRLPPLIGRAFFIFHLKRINTKNKGSLQSESRVPRFEYGPKFRRSFLCYFQYSRGNAAIQIGNIYQPMTGRRAAMSFLVKRKIRDSRVYRIRRGGRAFPFFTEKQRKKDGLFRARLFYVCSIFPQKPKESLPLTFTGQESPSLQYLICLQTHSFFIL